MTDEDIERLAEERHWVEVLEAVGTRDDAVARRFRLWARLETGRFTAAHVDDLRALLAGPIASEDRWSLWRLRAAHGRSLERLVAPVHAELVEAAWREQAPLFLENFLSPPLLGVMRALPEAWRGRRLQLGGAPAQVDPTRQRVLWSWLVDTLCDLEQVALSEVEREQCSHLLDAGGAALGLPRLAHWLTEHSRDTAPWEYLGLVLAAQSRATAERCVDALDALLLREDVLAHVPTDVDVPALAARLQRVVFRKTPLRALELALVELDDQRMGLVRRESPIAEYTWHEGALDDVLATVPDRRFEETVRAVMRK